MYVVIQEVPGSFYQPKRAKVHIVCIVDTVERLGVEKSAYQWEGTRGEIWLVHGYAVLMWGRKVRE